MNEITKNTHAIEKNRLALIGIIVEDLKITDKINDIIHEYNEYVVGRMGIPYKSRGIAIISIVIDAPSNIISTLSGKLGMLENVSAKVQYTKV